MNNLFTIPSFIKKQLLNAGLFVWKKIINQGDLNKNIPENKQNNANDKIKNELEPNISDSDLELLKLIEHQGIKGIWSNLDQDYSLVVNKLRDAKKSIKIIAYFGESVLNGLKSTLFNKLDYNEIKERFNIIVLTSRNRPSFITTPENYKFIKEVKKMEESAKGFKKHNDVKNCIEELRLKIKKENRKIEVGYYNTQVRYALIIIDDEWAWWTPYHSGIPTEECMSFVIVNKGEGSFFDLCSIQFDNIWRIAKKDKKNDI